MYTILIFSLILIISGFLKPRSKIIAILIFLFMWLLMGWNTGNPDFENYFSRYYRFSNLNGLVLNGIDRPGFSIINLFFKSLGFDFYQARIIISFTSLYLVYSSIRKFSLYPALVSNCYFIFIFALDVTQFRNFIAYSIVIYAIRFLFQEEKKGAIIFIFLVLIASSIHSACLFYLLFFFTRTNIKLKTILIALLITFVAKSILYEYYSLIFETDKLAVRYSQGISILAVFSIIIVQVLNAHYINVYKPFIINKDQNISIFNYKGQKKTIAIGGYYQNMEDILLFTNSNIIPIISLIFLILIPFYIDNMTYSRIFRNTVILNFIYISNHKLKTPFKYKPINTILLLLYGLFFFLYFFIFASGWVNIIQPILINNSIF